MTYFLHLHQLSSSIQTVEMSFHRNAVRYSHGNKAESDTHLGPTAQCTLK